jgi:hypothetical protein
MMGFQALSEACSTLEEACLAGDASPRRWRARGRREKDAGAGGDLPAAAAGNGGEALRAAP